MSTNIFKKKLLIAAFIISIVVLPSTVKAVTIEDLQAQIASLLAMISSLQQQLAEVTDPGDTPTTQCVTLNNNLWLGKRDSDTGGEVTKLQQFLTTTQDYTYGEATGYYGPATIEAVQRWQARKGIVDSGTPDTTGFGLVGPMTRSAMGDCGTSSTTYSWSSTAWGTCTNSTKARVVTCKNNLGVAVNDSMCTTSKPVTSQGCTSDPQYSACTFNSNNINHGDSVTTFENSEVDYGSQCISEVRTCNDGVLSGSYVNDSCSEAVASSCTLGGVTKSDGESSYFYSAETVPYGTVCNTKRQNRTCNNGAFSGASSYKYQTCSVLPQVQLVSQAQRKKLMDRRHGYAMYTKGGYYGEEYLVTSSANSGPGTLRDALNKTEPLWIVFNKNMTINLKSNLRARSNKTIDGRGHNITIRKYGIFMYGPASGSARVENVIITNLTIKDGASNSIDAISVARADNIWIDHVSLSNFKDGLIDITVAKSNGERVTVSNSKFMNHDKTALVGLHYGPNAKFDNKIYVTYSNNYFMSNTTQRHPRVARSVLHMYNNVVRWRTYGMASFDKARVFSERNWYVAGSNKIATKFRHGGKFIVGPNKGKTIPNGYIKSYGDAKSGGARVATYHPSATAKPWYKYKVVTANTTNKNRVIRDSGAHYSSNYYK